MYDNRISRLQLRITELKKQSDFLMMIVDETACKDDEIYFTGFSRGIDHALELIENLQKGLKP